MRLVAAVYPEVVFYGPQEQQVVALTIDDGPDPETTPAILDTLDGLDVKATFFLIGARAEAHPGLAREVARRGHEIGHHLWQDRLTICLPRPTLEHDVAATGHVLAEVAEVRWLRPGGGWVNAGIIEVAQAGGYEVVVGDVLPLDTRLPNPRLVGAFMLAVALPGSILTIHDYGDRGHRAVPLLERVVTGLRARGYTVGTLSALVPPEAVVEVAEEG